jgi:two-component system, chemotaxis family, chemotaxis protein CheY
MASRQVSARPSSSLDTTGAAENSFALLPRYTDSMIRLLVVDDAPFIREIVRYALRASKIEIVGEAEDGLEAVALARELLPDVVLMDIVLPGKSGIEATREILAANPRIRVVAFSTNDHESIVLKALDAGCCSFIVKPFQANELIAAIEQAVQPKSA